MECPNPVVDARKDRWQLSLSSGARNHRELISIIFSGALEASIPGFKGVKQDEALSASRIVQI